MSHTINLLNHPQPVYKDATLLATLLAACLLHLLLIFGIDFAGSKPSDAMMQDVTLIIDSMAKVQDPNKADFLAPQSQQGGGQSKQAQRITNTDISPYTLDAMEMVNPNESMRARQQALEEAADHYVLMTSISIEKEKRNKQKQTPKQANKEQAEQDSTAAMIATLEAEYAKQRQELAKSTGIKTVNSITAKSDPSAAYVDYFRNTVERIGNRYYPTAAKEQNLSGDVRLMVILHPNGSVKAVTLLKSSGHAVLDEAAKASVRYGAPYKQFPVALNGTSELRIIRTWRFSAGSNQPTVSAD